MNLSDKERINSCVGRIYPVCRSNYFVEGRIIPCAGRIMPGLGELFPGKVDLFPGLVELTRGRTNYSVCRTDYIHSANVNSTGTLNFSLVLLSVLKDKEPKYEVIS